MIAIRIGGFLIRSQDEGKNPSGEIFSFKKSQNIHPSF